MQCKPHRQLPSVISLINYLHHAVCGSHHSPLFCRSQAFDLNVFPRTTGAVQYSNDVISERMPTFSLLQTGSGRGDEFDGFGSSVRTTLSDHQIRFLDEFLYVRRPLDVASSTLLRNRLNDWNRYISLSLRVLLFFF